MYLTMIIFSAAGPGLQTENLLASIAAALHMNNSPLIGQNASKPALQKNPGVHINTEQPLVQVIIRTVAYSPSALHDDNDNGNGNGSDGGSGKSDKIGCQL